VGFASCCFYELVRLGRVGLVLAILHNTQLFNSFGFCAVDPRGCLNNLYYVNIAWGGFTGVIFLLCVRGSGSWTGFGLQGWFVWPGHVPDSGLVQKS